MFRASIARCRESREKHNSQFPLNNRQHEIWKYTCYNRASSAILDFRGTNSTEPKSRSEAERKRRSSGNHPILYLQACKQAMERGYIDTTRLYVLLTRGNMVGEKILRILGSLIRSYSRNLVSTRTTRTSGNILFSTLPVRDSEQACPITRLVKQDS